MNQFFSRNYHWILVGVSALIALGSAAFLIPHSSDLGTLLSAQAPVGGKIKDDGSGNATAAAGALDRLKKGALWKQRADGASPFVSRPYLLKAGQLVDPMVGNEPLHPPVPNQWLIDHQLDYTDMNILERDPKGKGFTIKEEYEAGTDPNNPNQFPPLCNKLGFAEGDIKKNTLTFEFLGEEESDGKKSYQLRPLNDLPNPERKGKPDRSTRNVAKGDPVPGAPFLKVVDYTDRKETIDDEDYDLGELTLENTITGEKYVIVKRTSSAKLNASKQKQIQVIENAILHYQLTGAPDETFAVERGKELVLVSLDKKFSETYKVSSLGTDGIVLEKGGKTFTVKPGLRSPLPVDPSATPVTPPAP